MLCKLLAATELAGNPGSHFHEPSLDAWLRRYKLDSRVFATDRDRLTAVFSAALELGKGNTEVFGVRLQRDSLRFFVEKLAVLHPALSSDRERIQAAFGTTQFIYLKRDDYLGQAISRLRAQQTGLWHSNADGSDLERMMPERTNGYDREAIEAYVQQAKDQNNDWLRWFAKEAIQPLVLTYDELSQNPQAALSRILTSLDVDGSVAASIPVQTRRLADETNLAWRSRYIAEMGG